MKRLLIPLLTSFGLLVALPAAAQDDVVTLVTHDSFAISESVIQAFQAETGYTLEILRAGDAGILVNQSVLSAGNPLGDVLFGVDNTFLTRALDGDIFLPYASPALEDVPESLQLDADENRVTPIDFGDVCLNYDAEFFAAAGAPPVPESLDALTDPAYAGLLTVQHPATSSPGLAFLMATIAAFGDSDDTDGYTYLDFWRDLAANDVYISEGWTDAYYGQFSGAAGNEGTRPLVVSYASSPAAEVYYAESAPEVQPTGAITGPGTCFRQIEFAGILDGTDNEAGAQALIDFMLTPAFQEDMPLNMFVYPVIPDAVIPQVFADTVTLSDEPVSLDPALIDANRERWIQEWVETVLQ
ncbi:MAG: thiamine ABC transporter substrate-binding protein [Pleurocapsa minor GSE-CHR-MK-17-07R]|jgi:thiamine transport system substrate-binding protein|nr:thiamine ABC transporter substrate-binding protein [Pleurocapsa minor GSE-CHR-MK 17-07R]